MANKPRALISVSDKSGVAEFALGLAGRGFEIISTGGTAKALRDACLSVTDVSKVTGFPEMMDGRLKTLHPLIHGGLLGRPEDAGVMEEYGITPISLLVVNLYPFEATIAKSGCALDEVVENIDIGGPAMLRAAAKNWQNVGVIVDPRDYGMVLRHLDSHGGGMTDDLRFKLAVKVFAHTAGYDAVVASYLKHYLPSVVMLE